MSPLRSALFAFIVAAAIAGCRQDTSRTQNNADPAANTAGTPGEPVANVPDDAHPSDSQIPPPPPDRSSRRPSLQRRSAVAKDKEAMAQAQPEGIGSDFTPPSEVTPPAETFPGSDITPPSAVQPPAEPVQVEPAPTPTPQATPPVEQNLGSNAQPGVPSPTPVRPQIQPPPPVPGSPTQIPGTVPQPAPGTTTPPTPSTMTPGTPQTTPPLTPQVPPQPSPQTPPQGITPQPFTPGPG